MEQKKIHPSLPSNYVTLAQLQQRWLNQQNQTKQSQPQHGEEKPQPQNGEEKPQPTQQSHRKVRTGTAPQSRPQKQQYAVKNRNDSDSLRRHAKEEPEYHRKLDVCAGMGDKTGDLNENVSSESKKKKKKKYNNKKTKLRTQEKGPSGEGSGDAAQRKIETDLKEETEKATVERGTKDKKNEGSVTMDSVEERVRVSSKNNSGNGKSGKITNGALHSQSQRNGGSVTVESVEERVRVSTNSGNRFHHSQSQRKHHSYGYGNFGHSNGGLGRMKNGFRRDGNGEQKREMVWVKKNEIVV